MVVRREAARGAVSEHGPQRIEMVHDPYWDLVHEPREPAFDAKRTALVIVAMQNMCGHPDGWMGRLGRDQGKPALLKESFEFIGDILPNLQRLLAHCRTTGFVVFLVCFVFWSCSLCVGLCVLLF